MDNRPISELDSAISVNDEDILLISQKENNEYVSRKIGAGVFRGDSAYDLAVKEGFKGDLNAWLSSIKGWQPITSGEFVDLLDSELSKSKLYTDLTSKINTSTESLRQDINKQIEDVNALRERVITEADKRIQEIRDLNNGLIDEANKRIQDIEIIRESVTLETDDRLKQAIELANQILLEREHRTDDIKNLVEKLNNEQSDRVSAIEDVISLLSSEVDSRREMVREVVGKITEEANQRIKAIDAIQDTINKDQLARVAEIEEILKNIDSLDDQVGTNHTFLLNNYSTTKTANELTAKQIEALRTTYIDPKLEQKASTTALEQITTEVGTINDALQANITKTDGVFAKVNPSMAGTTSGSIGDESKYVGVWTEQSARIEEDFALGKRVDNVVATYTSNKETTDARIAREEKARADGDSALASIVTSLTTRVGNSEGKLITLEQVTTDTDSSLSQMSSKLDNTIQELDTKASSSALSDLSSNVEILEDGLKSTTNSVTFLQNSIDTINEDISKKANSSALTELSSKVTLLGDDLSSTSNNITALTSSLGSKNKTYYQPSMPTENVVSGDLWVNSALGKNNELKRYNGLYWDLVSDPRVSANSSAISSLESTTSQHGDNITSQGKRITDLQSEIDLTKKDVAVKANASALEDLSSKVVNVDGKVTSVSEDLLRLDNTLNQVESNLNLKADSSALRDLTSKVEKTDENLRSQSQDITSLNNSLTTVNTNINTKGKVIYLDTEPSQQDRLPQNLWIDTSDNKNTPKRWNGSEWAVVSDKVALDALSKAKLNEEILITKADSSAVAALTNKVEAAEKSITSQSTDIVSLKNSLSETVETVGEKGRIIFSSVQPPEKDRSTLNLWIDLSNDSNTPKRWTGTQWKAVSDKVALDALAAANTVTTALATKADASAVSSLDSKVSKINNTVTSQSTDITTLNNSMVIANNNISSKGKIIYSDSAPAEGDRLPQNLWIDTTAGGNIPKRWNGQFWLAVTDKTALDALAAANKAKEDLATKVDSSAFNSLTSRVSSSEKTITSQSDSITKLNNSLTVTDQIAKEALSDSKTLKEQITTKASTEALENLSSSVASIDGRVTSNTQKVLELTGTVETIGETLSTKADASVLTDYSTKVDTNEAISNANTTLTSSYTKAVNDAKAETNVKLDDQLLISKASTSGKLLYPDVTFLEGVNSVVVFDRNGTGKVVVSRVTREIDNPTKSSHQLKITIANGATPGYGGFYQPITARANAVFVIKYLMKVPTTYTVVTASNALGSNSSDKIIGSTAGTGKYETYIRVVRCGDSGSFSTGGHLYFYGTSLPAGSTDTIMLASIECWDATDFVKSATSSEVASINATLVNKYYTKTSADQAIADGLTAFQTNYVDRELNKKASANTVEQINNEITNTDTGLKATANKLSGVYAQVNPELIGSDKGFIGKDSGSVSVWSEYSARIEGDTALSSRIDSVKSEWENSLAVVQTQTKTATDRLSSLASQVTVLSSAVDGNLSLVMDQYYTKVQTNDVVSQNIVELKANYISPQLGLKASAQALQETQSQVTEIDGKLKTTSQKTDGVYAQINPELVGNSTGSIGNNTQKVGAWTQYSALIEGDFATAQKIDAVSVKVDNNSANIQQMNTVVVTNSKAAAEALSKVEVKFNDNLASLSSTIGTWTEKDKSISKYITDLTSVVDNNKADISKYYLTSVDTTKAITEGIDRFKTEYVSEELKKKATAEALDQVKSVIENTDSGLKATADKLEGVFVKVNPKLIGSDKEFIGKGSGSVGVWTEYSARLEEDFSLGRRVDSLYADLGKNAAAIQTINEVMVDKTQSLAKSITNIDSKFESSVGSINTKLGTWTTSESSISDYVMGINSVVGENSSSIQVQGRSIDGLSSQYTVKIDTNGRVSGFGLASNPTNQATSEFAVVADKFYIAGPQESGKGKSPFYVLPTQQVIGGVTVPAGTYIDQSFIRKASIDTAHIRDAAIVDAKIFNLDASKITTGFISADRIEAGTIQSKHIGVNAIQPTNFSYEVYKKFNETFVSIDDAYSDGKLTPIEKRSIKEQVELIDLEFEVVKDSMATFKVPHVRVKYDALKTYLETLDLNSQTVTVLDRMAYEKSFADYYAELRNNQYNISKEIEKLNGESIKSAKTANDLLTAWKTYGQDTLYIDDTRIAVKMIGAEQIATDSITADKIKFGSVTSKTLSEDVRTDISKGTSAYKTVADLAANLNDDNIITPVEKTFLFDKWQEIQKVSSWIDWQCTNIFKNSQDKETIYDPYYTAVKNFIAERVSKDGLNVSNNIIDFAISWNGKVIVGSEAMRQVLLNYYEAENKMLGKLQQTQYNFTSNVNDKVTTASSVLDNIANDNIITKQEKPALKLQYTNIINDYDDLILAANNQGLTSSNFTTAYTQLVNAFDAIFANMTVDTNWSGSDLRAKMKDYSDQRGIIVQTLSNDAKNKANEATLNALAALQALGKMSDDNVITIYEKPALSFSWQNIINDYDELVAACVTQNVSSTEFKTAYTNLKQAVDLILANPKVDTEWNGADLRNRMKAYADARGITIQRLSNDAKAEAEAAMAAITDAVSDRILTPSEKQQFKIKWIEEYQDFEKLKLKAQEAGINTSTGNYTGYVSAFNYINDTFTPVWNSADNSQVDPTEWKTRFENLRKYKALLENEISLVIKNIASTALANTQQLTDSLKTKADSSALMTLDHDVTTIEGTVESYGQSLTELNNNYSSLVSKGGSLIADYTLKNPNDWVSHYNYDLKPYFTTVADGKVANTVFRKPKEVVNSWNYSRHPVSNDRAYKVSMWVRRETGSTGSIQFTWRKYDKTGLPTSSYGNSSVSVVADGAWYQVSAIINDTANKGTYPQIAFGFALNHGNSGYYADMQGFKVESVISLADADSTVASSSALSSLTSRVTGAEGNITSQGQSITTLQNSVSNLNGTLATKADASALSSLDSKVTSIEGNVSSQGSNIVSLSNSLDTANVNLNAKGKIIYSATVPVAADQLTQNLWIDTTGGANTPKRWSGTAWIAVTDKVATDAANAASAAQNSANQANATITDITVDNKLTPVEKRQVKLIIDDIKQVDIDIKTRAAKYSISTTAYTDSYNTLMSYINPILADLTTTTVITRTTFNTNFNNFFTSRAALDTSIVNEVRRISDLAQSTADNKGEVIYSATTPPASKQLTQNLWIDTANGANTPKRWNGTAWAIVTDKVASDALAAANQANSTLATKADASAVESLTNRVTGAEGAITTQSGKVVTLENSLSTTTATANKALTAVTVADTRSTNELPSWYWSNYPKRIVNEFKTASAVGVTGLGAYVNLETRVYYSDSSGGPIIQTAYSPDNMLLQMTRKSTSTTAWAAWSQPLKSLSDTVNTKADASAVSSLDSKVTGIDGRVTTNAESITTLKGNVTTINNNLATKADASALSDYYTIVQADKAISGKVEEFKSTYSETILPTDKDTSRVNTWSRIVYSKKAPYIGINVVPDYSYLVNYKKHSEDYFAEGRTMTVPVNNSINYYRAVITVSSAKVIDLGNLTGDDAHAVYVDNVKVHSATGYSTNPCSFQVTAGEHIIDIIVNNGTGSAGFSSTNTLSSQVNSMYAVKLIYKDTELNASAISSTDSRITNVDGNLTVTSKSVQDLTTTVGQNTANISTVASSVDGIKTEYSVKLNVNGKVSGFGLISGPKSSDFSILSDTFKVSNGSTDIAPFSVINNEVIFNGKVSFRNVTDKGWKITVIGTSAALPTTEQYSGTYIDNGNYTQDFGTSGIRVVIYDVNKNVQLDNLYDTTTAAGCTAFKNAVINLNLDTQIVTIRSVGFSLANNQDLIAAVNKLGFGGSSLNSALTYNTKTSFSGISQFIAAKKSSNNVMVINADVEGKQQKAITSATIKDGVLIPESIPMDTGSHKLNEAADIAIDTLTPSIGVAQTTANSKSKTFTAQPTVPYSMGDLWKNGTTVLVSTVSRATGSFTSADWIKVGDVTSENTAKDTTSVNGVSAATVVTNAQTGKTLSDNVMSDLVLTPVEKSGLLNEWNRIKAEYATLSTQALSLAIDKTALDTAYTALNGASPRIETEVLVSMVTNYTLTTTTRDSFKSKLNTYYQQATAVSKNITNAVNNLAATAQSTANSKAKTFTATPTIPYSLGDIWKNGNAIYVSTVNRLTGSYTASDWVLVGDVTSNNTSADTSKVNGISAATVTANASKGAAVYDDVMSDLKITPVEKTAISQEWSRIQKEYASLVAQATSLSVPTTTLTSAYNGLSKTDPAMSTILSSMSTTTTLTAAQRDAYKAQYTAYYTQSVATVKAINEKIAENAKADLDNLEIGGRNLFQQSNYGKHIHNGSINSSATSAIIKVEPNTTYTISYKVTTSNRFGIYQGNLENGILTNPILNISTIIAYRTTTPDTLINSTFTTSAVGEYIMIYLSYDIGQVKEPFLKVEKGNKATDWTAAPEDVELDTYKKTHLPVRYIRDWANGSSANTSNHWYEIQAYSNGVNVARNKSVTTNGTATSLTAAVDGSSSGTYANTGVGYHHLTVDLGQIYYDISEIKIWKYWNDGRTYRKTKTEVSSDGSTWFTIFDSYVEGEYPETSSGKSIIPLISRADSLPLLAAAADRAQVTIDSVSNITADDKITPNEKRDLLRVKDEIVSTHTELLKSVNTVPGAATPSTYTTAYSTVTSRLTSATTSPTTITSITAADRTNLTAALSTYFTERAKLNDMLLTKTKEYTESQVREIEVGGRNLIVLSAGGIEESKYLNATGAVTSSTNWFVTDNIPVTPGTSYILSGYRNLGSAPSTVFYDASGTYISGIAGTARRIVTAPVNATSMRVSLEKADKPTIKLEKGNKATDWTPAPEDVDIAIASKAKTFVTTPTVPYSIGDIWKEDNTVKVCTTERLTGVYTASDWTLVGDVTANNTAADTAKVNGINAATVANNAAKGLEVYNDVMSDLKITPVEKTAISQEWSRIQKEYASLLAQAQTLGLTTTAYTSAYTGLSTTAPAMSTILASMSTTTTLTAAERDAYKAQYTDYYTQAVAITKAINDKIASNAKTDLDNIQIGGRNLLKGSALIQFTGSDNGNGGASVVVGDFVRLTPVNAGNIYGSNASNGALVTASELLPGEQYTYSVMVKTTMTSIGLYCYSGGNHIKYSIPLKSGNVWEKVSFTFTQATARAKNFTFLAGFHQLQADVVVEYRNFKLEKGNKATDWSPAPEDVDTAIESKSKTFVTTPTVPYSIGDLWKDGDAVKVCTTARLTGTYTISDWTLAGDVTSNNTSADTAKVNGVAAATVATNAQAGKTLSDNVMSDLIITPVEKSALLTEWNRIKAEYNSIVAQATALSVDKTALTTAYTALDTTSPKIASEILANMTTNYVLTTTTRDAFKAQLNTYFVQATAVTKAITDKVNSLLGIAQDTADSKAKTFTSTPTVPYSAGDIWRNGNTIYVSTVTRATGSYTAADWTKASDVTSENTSANTSSVGSVSAASVATLVSDMSNDSKLIPAEKRALNAEWERIKNTYPALITQAVNLGATYTRTAYDALAAYIPSLALTSQTTTAIVATTFRTNFSNYYVEEATILKNIQDKQRTDVIAVKDAIPELIFAQGGYADSKAIITINGVNQTYTAATGILVMVITQSTGVVETKTIYTADPTGFSTMKTDITALASGKIVVMVSRQNIPMTTDTNFRDALRLIGSTDIIYNQYTRKTNNTFAIIGTKGGTAGSANEAVVSVDGNMNLDNATTSGTLIAGKLSPNSTTFVDGGLILTNSINANSIKAGSIAAAQIEGGSITGDKIKAGSITAAQIEGGSITGDKIKANTSITAPTINGGNINIGNGNFVVDQWGNLNANSGTFRGTVLAENISGKIDVESLKNSAWMGGYTLFLKYGGYADYTNYSALIPSKGTLLSFFEDYYTIKKAKYSINLLIKDAVTIKQYLVRADDDLDVNVYQNGSLLYTRHYTGSYNNEISIPLPAGLCTLEFIVSNDGQECGIVLLGDFIDNKNIKYA